MSDTNSNPPRGPIYRAAKALGLLNVATLTFLALGIVAIKLNETALRVFYPRGLPDWGAEVSTYMMAWGLMLSLPVLVLRGENIAADFLANQIPDKVRHAIGLGEDIAGAVFCAFVAWGGHLATELAQRLGQISDTSLQFPMWMYILAVPVGFGLSSVAYVLRLAARVWPSIRSWKAADR
ncbi:TRAP transporter small permease [Notoacmeibacter marinus]|uniref:TRAP transporter small permease n=1 Tax=Notoacmeibacter marinus TaxID=1876515 RepID=UPI000DF36117|nr:TRAP transporter small permease [Notoacmeibacter marinus]